MRFLIAAVLALTGPLLFAAEPVEEETATWYDVELVVFRNLETRSSESWPPDAGIPAVENARALFPAAEPSEDSEATTTSGLAGNDALGYPGTPTPYVPLDESAYRLIGVVDSLQRSSNYEPILHVAWTQPPLDRNEAPSLRITLPGTLEPPEPDADEALPDDAQEPLPGRGQETQDDELRQQPLPSFLAEEEQESALARPLDGTVQLSVSRYLHINLDLIYLPEDLNLNVLDAPVATREWTEAEERERDERHRAIRDALARGDITLEEAEILALEPEKQAFEGFRLNQVRRLRSGEVHYFDHPVYGVIVKVTPREVSARTHGLEDSQQLR